MAEIVWTDRAQQDLREIIEYIARDSKAYAQSFGLRLRSSVDRLAAFPESGRVIPEDPGGGVREVIVQDYRVLYKIAPDRVVALTIVHGMRLLKPPTQGEARARSRRCGGFADLPTRPSFVPRANRV